MIRVRSVAPREGYRVLVEFTDDTRREIDLEPYLHGAIFEPLRRDRALFAAVAVDPELGTLAWPNGADIDPDVLREGLSPPWTEPGPPAPRERSE